jgi:peptide-methionine (R)-S-oxide reductase
MRKISVILAIAGVAGILSCQNINGQAQQPKGPKGKPAAEWKKQLNPNAYRIMVEKGTEPPFNNAYWNNHEKGVYVSAATGDVLFTSDTKFESGTGWPSFTRPVSTDKVLLVRDADGERTEVVERSTGLHLGHVFDDGPEDKGGKRYCMNSAALKFIKK